jgi:serine/threonine-protein kinase
VLRGALQPIGCTLADVQLPDPGHVILGGLAGAGQPETALRNAIAAAAPAASLTWQARTFTGPYCAALDVLRGAADPRYPMLRMALKDNASRLLQNDHIVMQFTMPDFPAHLLVDYFASDGSITHLVVDTGSNVQVMTDTGWRISGPSHLYQPGELVTIGEPDPKTGEVGWAVDEPFGTDMIVAIASSVPLFTAARPTDDPPATYLRDLQAALNAATASGAYVITQAILLDTAKR